MNHVPPNEMSPWKLSPWLTLIFILIASTAQSKNHSLLSGPHNYNATFTISTVEVFTDVSVDDAVDLTISSTGSLTCSSLDFLNGTNSLTVESGGVLILTGILTGNVNTTITIEHGGSFVTNGADFTDGGFVSNIIIEKTASAAGYSYVSMPVTTGTYTAYEYYFSESTLDGDYGSWINSVNGAPKEAGIGYAIYQQGPISFTGTPNNAAVNLSLSLTSQATRTDKSGQHLVGNPYPAAIRMDNFFALGDNAANTFANYYIWDPADNGGLGGYSPILGSSESYIASGQAFFIQLDYSTLADGDHPIVFDPSIMVADNNSTFYRTADYDYSQVVLNFSTPNDTKNQLSFLLDEEFSPSFDKGFEAYSIPFEEAGKLRVKTSYNNKYFDILAVKRGESHSFPISVTTSEQLPVDIELIGLDRVPANYKIELINKTTGEAFDLTANPKVSMSFNKVDAKDELLLRILNPDNVLSTEVSRELSAYHSDNKLTVRFSGTHSQLGNISVYTLDGRLVKSWSVLDDVDTFSEIFNPKGGLYIVKVETPKGIFSQKIIIK